MYQDRKTALGSAFTKDQQWLYTWWTDGSVTRIAKLRAGEKLEDIVSEEVVPAVEWNRKDFLPLSSHLS